MVKFNRKCPILTKRPSKNRKIYLFITHSFIAKPDFFILSLVSGYIIGGAVPSVETSTDSASVRFDSRSRAFSTDNNSGTPDGSTFSTF